MLRSSSSCGSRSCFASVRRSQYLTLPTARQERIVRQSLVSQLSLSTKLRGHRGYACLSVPHSYHAYRQRTAAGLATQEAVGAITRLISSVCSCINTIVWDPQGSRLLTGSDDCFIIIYGAQRLSEQEPYELRARVQTGHTGNIFSAQFVPDGTTRRIVTCAADGTVRLTDIERTLEVLH